MSQSDRSVAEVLGFGQDAEGPTRHVLYDDGTEGVQHATVTVEGEITRADGSTEQAVITDINVTAAGVHYEED